MRWLSHLITIVVLVAVTAGLVVFIRSRLPKTAVGQKFETYAKFRDASKLVIGSPIVIAGVRIGEITGMVIEGRFARVDMRLRDNTDIGVDSLVTKRAPSTFGDSYLEILPSGGEPGAANEQRLVSGEPLTHVLEGASTDAVLRATERSMPRLEAGVASLYAFMTGGRAWVNGMMVGGLTTMNDWLEQGTLDRPLRKTDDALDKIEAGTERATRALGGSKGDDAAVKLGELDAKITTFRAKLADARVKLGSGFADTRSGLDRVDEQLAQAHDVMAAINNGSGDDWKGKLGRLVNDPELADTILDATESARDSTASFDRFKAYLGVRIEANVMSRLTRIYVTTEIRAHDDKIYLLELEKGLLGTVPGDTISDAAGTTAYTRTQAIQDKLRFTAQFGRVFGPLTIRGGIKSSTFGAGADLLTGRLTMSADVFGSYQKTPNVKLAVALMIYRSVYLVGGVDDMLNKPGYLQVERGNVDVPAGFDRLRYGRDYFLGAQLRFNDEDITTLLRVYGALLATAL